MSYTLDTEIHYPSTSSGDSSGSTDPGDDFSIDWTPIILLLIVVIIVIVVIAGVASVAGKKGQTPMTPPPPMYSQPAQQTQYQQPQQKYCSSCGKSIPPDSVMCPYCGGK